MNRNANNVTCETLKGWSSQDSYSSSHIDSPAAAYDKKPDKPRKIATTKAQSKRGSPKKSDSSAEYSHKKKVPVLVSTFKYE